MAQKLTRLDAKPGLAFVMRKTTAATNGPAYVIVTPVRDEARFIGDTVDSVLAQTHLPLRWVIVDDGSTDPTVAIVKQRIQGLAWVTLISTGSTQRQLGSAEVLAFQLGVDTIDPATPYDYIVKLDGDLRLPPNYFERLLVAMSARPRWGIASGVYCEWKTAAGLGAWQVVPMPAYHAAGASKVVQRQCFEEMGGFVPRKGWDTVDEIRAGLLGWHTGHVPEVVFEHLKPEGQAMGSLATHRFHGEIYYQTGGGWLFLLVKLAHRMVVGRPILLGGVAMLWGFVVSSLLRRNRLVSDEEALFYRRLLNQRLVHWAQPVSRWVHWVRA
jgi:poly-beta-1,6-N-acetyl-D-glucosamine synthase